MVTDGKRLVELVPLLTDTYIIPNGASWPPAGDQIFVLRIVKTNLYLSRECGVVNLHEKAQGFVGARFGTKRSQMENAAIVFLMQHGGDFGLAMDQGGTVGLDVAIWPIPPALVNSPTQYVLLTADRSMYISSTGSPTLNFGEVPVFCDPSDPRLITMLKRRNLRLVRIPGAFGCPAEEELVTLTPVPGSIM